MASQKPHQATGAVKARVIPTVPHGNPLQIDGEILRLQGLVTAYHRNLKQTMSGHQRIALQKALRRTRAQLRLARRQSRSLEAV